MLNDYDGIQHDFTRKKGLIWQDVFLPEFAPPEWKDRSVLWNAVEKNERRRTGRLAREFVPALPIELTPAPMAGASDGFYPEQFYRRWDVRRCCRPRSISSRAQSSCPYHGNGSPFGRKRELAVQDRERISLCPKRRRTGLYRRRIQSGAADGGEKQYPYKVGRKKVYLPPSEAEKHGYERVSKYPKSTKYGRQIPTSERWNSEEQLVQWRKRGQMQRIVIWNGYGHEERIDHRSHAERGLDEQPTIS